MAGGHADHVQKRRQETTAQQAVVRRGLVEIEGAGNRHDRLEMRRPLDGGLHLGAREVADADHSDIAIGPGLGGGPLDQVVHIMALLAVEEAERAARSAGAAAVGNHVDVAARHEEITRTGLDEPERRAQVLDLPGIG